MPVVPAENMKDYIGKELGVSDWFVVDQERINKFADVTEDHQFIHSLNLFFYLVFCPF